MTHVQSLLIVVAVATFSTGTIHGEAPSDELPAMAVTGNGGNAGFIFFGSSEQFQKASIRTKLQLLFSPLHEVIFLNHEVTPVEISLLAKMARVRSLQIGDSPDLVPITSKTIEGIPHLSALESLVVHGKCSSPIRWSALARCQGLESLEIRGDLSLSKKDVQVLASIESLRHLVLAVDFGGTTIELFDASPTLETIELHANEGGKALKLNLAIMDSLESLRVSSFQGFSQLELKKNKVMAKEDEIKRDGGSFGETIR